MTEAVERVFSVNGYRLAAREWHPGASSKVIALHGWLDNAASFDVLSPLLSSCHVIALDLAGHGYSDHRPAQASYNIWDDLLDILAVADEMGWQHFQLLGHSRGAIISLLLGATCPERVRAMLLLDGIWPLPVNLEDSATQLATFIHENRAMANKTMPTYTSVEQAVSARCKSARMSELAARPIIERGLKQCGVTYQWASDPRLRIASAVKLTQGHLDAIMAAVSIPCKLLLAEQGMGAHQDVRERLQAYPMVDCQLLPGSHHFHMEAEAGEIAAIASEFFSADLPD